MFSLCLQLFDLNVSSQLLLKSVVPQFHQHCLTSLLYLLLCFHNTSFYLSLPWKILFSLLVSYGLPIWPTNIQIFEIKCTPPKLKSQQLHLREKLNFCSSDFELTYLDIWLSSFIHKYENKFLLTPKNIPLCKCNALSLSIYWLMEI